VAGLNERNVREWVRAMTTERVVECDVTDGTDRYSMYVVR
jgi:hypothetical protein